MNRRDFTITSSLGILGTLLYGCDNASSFPFKKDQIIGCLGDSVTYAGGNGYVEQLQVLADQIRPELNLTFINWGKSSETITGLTENGHPGPRPYLFARLDELLKNTKVDHLLFCYGINCGIYGKPSEELFNRYKISLYTFLEKIKQQGITAILLTPPPLTLKTVPIDIDTSAEFTWMNPYPEYDAEVIQKFKKIVLTTSHQSILSKIDIHSPLSQQQDLCYDKDPIHPNLVGQRLIATTIIEKLGF